MGRIVSSRRDQRLLARMGDGARRAHETEFNRTTSLEQFERVFGPVIRPEAT